MSWRWRAGVLVALAALATVATGCEAKDIAVFELAAPGDLGGAGGSGGQPQGGGDSGFAGSGGSSSGGGVGGTPETLGGTGGLAGSAGTAGSAGSAGSDAGIGCVSNSNCPQGWFCEKVDCVADRGLCDLRPTKPTLDYQPVCGCDGVTYWNDIARRQAGATLLQPEQCSTTARPCDVPQDCLVMFASCGRLVSRGESCAPGGQGACWLLPPRCPDPSSDPDIWLDCRPPQGGSLPPPCTDTCGAIRDGHAHQQPRDPKMCFPPP